MNKLNELINKLCPNCVEFRRLGEIAKRNSGTSITATQMKVLHKENALVKIFSAGNTVANVSCADIPKKDIIERTSIIVKSRGYIGFEYYDKPFSHKQEMWSYTLNDGVNTRFVYYYLSTKIHFFQEKARANSVKLPQLSVADTDKFLIPLPPLDIQQEIVRILDTFAELQTELQTELQIRKVQYEHYRNSLLTFGDDVERKTLGEVCDKIYSGNNTKRVNDGQFSVYGSTGVIGKTDDAIYSGKNLLVARVGANAGFVHVADGQYDISDNTLIIKMKENEYNLRFAYHQLTNMQLNRFTVGGGQPLITAGLLKELEIGIPTLAEQTRIVEILDRFEALATDLTQGLPAEIEARRKQYEYYRNKLLTFKECV